MAPAKLLGLLLLLFICITFAHSSKTKKIKIHVPYYVKHIHHFKKVYVPKVQVVKHEHVHKKELVHHHHKYDKNDGGHHDDYDSYYDDFDHRSYNDRLPKSQKRNPFHRNWREGQSSEELTSSEENDYITGPDDEGTVPAPSVNHGRFRPRPTGTVGPKFRRAIVRRAEVPTTATTKIIVTPAVQKIIKRIVSTEET